MLIRSVADGDRDAIFALGVAEEAAWFGQAEISAEEIGEWIEEEGGVASGVVAVDDAGNVCGFAAPGRHQAVFLADPARASLLADELLPWLRERCDVVRLMTFAGDMARVAAFERHGLWHLRSSFLMARSDSFGPLSVAVFPQGVEVAPYRFGDDDQAVHRLVYVDAAWASVAGHAERDLEQWLDMVRRCRSAFVARRNGRPVGWVAGRVLASGRGHVDMLAVAMSERHRGLGRALLLHALADLQLAGGCDLTLDAQAENEAALGLYRSVGMEVEHEWRLYALASNRA
ncbi:MAG: GNAT family N-acetyltransferase [Solirubrobacteraceae bacterium]